jgi:hypothetical protein
LAKKNVAKIVKMEFASREGAEMAALVAAAAADLPP